MKKKETEHKKNWRETYASVEDIERFLSDHVMLRHNVITRRVEYHLLTQFGDEMPAVAHWEPLTDRVVNSLWVEMAGEKPTRVQDMVRVIESDFVPDYHPFRFYLEQLPKWKEDEDMDYIMDLAMTVHIKDDTQQMLFCEYLKKWLVGMVAGWVNDMVVNNVMLVLIGQQGAYKTTWFNYLLPPELRSYFYTKTNANRMGRDDLLTLAQYGLVCCEELDSMRPWELNQLKAAMTMTSIDERAAYARYQEHRPPIASFCGTGNNVQFLSDATGNRRWLPFEVESILSPRDTPFQYVGIYAQAYSMYRQGFQYWFSPEEIQQLARHNQQFETACLERELVDQYFRRPQGQEPGEFMPVSLAIQIVGANITQKLSTIMLGRAFMDLGYEHKRTHSGRGYLVVRRSAEEMKAMRNQLAVPIRKTDTPGVTDVTDVTAVF